MKRFSRFTALALAGVLSLSLLTGCQTATPDSSASTSTQEEAPIVVDLAAVKDICKFLSGVDGDEVVAKADGLKVTAGELMYWITANCDSMLQYYYYYYGVSELPWDTTDSAGETSLADFVLDDAIKFALLQRIIDRTAKKAGKSVSAEDLASIDAAMEAMEVDFAADGVTLEQYLFQQGLTGDLYRWNCECDYLYNALAETYFGENSDNPPTEESIRAMREANGEYKVKHILLASVDTATREALDEKTVAEKKAAAEALLAQLRTSEDPMTLFDEYMNTLSEDPGLLTNPEGYTFTANTSVDPAFEEAALALEPGQISEVIEGVSGYHIILRLPLDVNVDEDTQTYIDSKMSQLTDQWLEEAEIKTTKAFDKLDAKQIYTRATAYRQAVSDLASAAETTTDPAPSQE